jgi:XRE family transcriptional regulator, regulator of sulfur utilization
VVSVVARRFGANLHRARKRSGLSQETLAARAELHRTHIGLLEKGARVARIDTLIKLAVALDCDPVDLIAGIEWRPAQVGDPGGYAVSDG